MSFSGPRLGDPVSAPQNQLAVVTDPCFSYCSLSLFFFGRWSLVFQTSSSNASGISMGRFHEESGRLQEITECY